MSTLTVATVKSNSSSPPAFQNTSGTEIGRLCRAFVNFNGTGTVAINGQYNVSSITDNGVGNYTLNFTTAFPDVNYTPVTASQEARVICSVVTASFATSSVQIRTYDEGGVAYFDANPVLVAIFR